MSVRWAGLLSVAMAACLSPAPDWAGPGGAGTGGGSGDDGSGDADPDDSGDGAGEGGTGTDPPVPPPLGCAALPAAVDAVSVTPDDDLAAAVAGLGEGQTLLLQGGTYTLAGIDRITIVTPSVTIRSAGGDPDAVIIEGGADTVDLLDIRADGVTIAELSLRQSSDHLIAITPAAGERLVGTTIYRARLQDSVNKLIHVHTPGIAEDGYADLGRVACSEFRITTDYRDAAPDCSGFAGIRLTGGDGWVFEDNLFEGFWCGNEPSEPALALTNGTRDAVVRRNFFVDNYQALRVGEGDGVDVRVYGDGPCAGRAFDAYGGTAVNNVFVNVGEGIGLSAPGIDAMIMMWGVCGTEVYHNSQYTAFPMFSAIEWRFPGTVVYVANNLTHGELRAREDAVAFGLESNRFTDGTDYVDPTAIDLHLVGGAEAIDDGVALPNDPVPLDLDGNARVGASDLGAFERSAP